VSLDADAFLAHFEVKIKYLAMMVWNKYYHLTLPSFPFTFHRILPSPSLSVALRPQLRIRDSEGLFLSLAAHCGLGSGTALKLLERVRTEPSRLAAKRF